MKIQVVDDEKVLVKGIKFNLESEGYQVGLGRGGGRGVEGVARARPLLPQLGTNEDPSLQRWCRISTLSSMPVFVHNQGLNDPNKLIQNGHLCNKYNSKCCI